MNGFSGDSSSLRLFHWCDGVMAQLFRFIEKPARVEKVERVYRQHDHSSVAYIEVHLGPDDVPVPPVRELDCSVDRSDEYAGRVEAEREHHDFQPFAWHVAVRIILGLRLVADHWPVAKVAPEEFHCEEDVDGDGEHLKNDTTEHDMGTLIRIGQCQRSGGDRSSDGLYDKGDNVKAAENDCIPHWRQPAVLNAQPANDGS